MTDRVQVKWRYFGGALGLHILLIVSVVVLNWQPNNVIVPQLAIKGVIVSPTALNALVHKPVVSSAEEMPDEQENTEQLIEQQQQAQARLQKEQLLLKQKEELARIEHQKQLAAEKDKQEKMLEQRKAVEAEQKKQQQEAEKKRLADLEQKKRDEQLKRQADAEAKAKKEHEAELRAQMAEEEGRANAVNAGLLNQYIALIQQKVMRNWIRPQTAKSGLECEVRVTQASGGTVLSVTIGRCNGDQAVRTSIETAVRAASPLPAPPDARLFERNLLFVFKPAE